MKLSFTGNRALILGGTCDIAICLASRMIRSEIFPILTCRDLGGREHIEGALMPWAGRYATLRLDFSKPETLAPLELVLEQPVDFLVDFAQTDFESLVAGADDNTVQQYFERNLSFRAAVLKRVGRTMLKQRRGRLVYVSSSAAFRPNPGQGFYAAAKQASEALYRSMGLEMGKRGITTVTLRPGYVNSGRGRRYTAKKEDALSRIPAGKLLEPEHVAETILFFLSESATGFNATEITMDGGLTAGK